MYIKHEIPIVTKVSVLHDSPIYLFIYKEEQIYLFTYLVTVKDMVNSDNLQTPR